LLTPNISTIVETGDTYINTKFVSRENAEAGDIIVFHEENNVKTVKYMKPEAFDSNDEYWTPDAIVVVPCRHTSDGTIRAMALNYASVTTPSDGGDAEKIVWGHTPILSDIKAYGEMTIFSTVQDQTFESTHSTSPEGYLPSDAFENGVLNPYDTKSYYTEDGADSNIILSSPYNNDGSKNDAFHSTGDFSSFEDNPLNDMDGDKNTAAYLKTLDSSHLTEILYGQTITNSVTQEIGIETVLLYPLAMACARYSSELKPCVFDTENTLDENLETMPWYLPSAGEIGYYLSRKGIIDYALEQVGKEPRSADELGTSTIGDANIIQHDAPVISVDENSSLLTYVEGNSGQMYGIPFCKF